MQLLDGPLRRVRTRLHALYHCGAFREKRKACLALLAFLLCLTVGAAVCASRFFDNTQPAVKVPIGSKMDVTETFLIRQTHGIVMTNPVFVKLEIPNDALSIGSFSGEGCYHFLLEEFTLWATVELQRTKIVDRVLGAASSATPAPFASHADFLRDNGSTTLLLVNVRAGKPVPPIVDVFRGKYDDYRFNWTNSTVCSVPSPPQITVTSVVSMALDMKDSVAKDLMRVDLVSIPLALLCVICCIKSVRLLLVVLATIPVAVCLALGCNYPISNLLVYSTVTPEVVSATAVALSIDFALFFLSRFIDLLVAFEPLRDGHSLSNDIQRNTSVAIGEFTCVNGTGERHETSDRAANALVLNNTAPAREEEEVPILCARIDPATAAKVTSMTAVEFQQFIIVNAWLGSVKNITFSGFTVAAVFACLCNSSIPVVQTVGIGCLIAAVCSAVASLAVAPALLFVAYDFFTRRSPRMDSIKTWVRMKIASTFFAGVRGSEPLLGKSHAFVHSSPYRKIATFATVHKYLTLLLLLLVAAPFGYAVSHLRLNFDLMTEVPVHANDVENYKIIAKEFGNRVSYPFYLVFQFGAKMDEVIPITKGLIDEVSSAAVALEGDTRRGIPVRARIASPFIFNSEQPLTPLEVATAETNWVRNLSDGRQYMDHLWSLCQGSVKPHSRIGYFGVSSCLIGLQLERDDPFRAAGMDVLKYLDDFVERYGGPGSLYPHLLGYFGPNADSFTLYNVVYGEFRFQLMMIAATMFCCVFLVFGSLMLAVRLVVTVLYSGLISYGTASFIYCIPTHLYSSTSQLSGVDSVQWIIPIIATPFMIALACDYDAFLLVRFVEFRLGGHTDESAIVMAVEKTGRVISFAGAIMALALGSLMVSDSVMLQQFGLLMFVNVLVDAFVVRPLLVPALMAVLPALLWFPRSDLPAGKKDAKKGGVNADVGIFIL